MNPFKSEDKTIIDSNPPVKFELSTFTIVKVVLFIVGLWLISKLTAVILVLIMALIIVGALIPIVKWLEGHKIPRKFSIAIVFISLLIITTLFVTLTIPELLAQIQSGLEQEPNLRAKLIAYLGHSRVGVPLAEYLRKVKYDTLVLSSALSAWEFTKNAFEIFAYILLTLFLALYIMIDRDRLRGGLFAVVPRTYHIRLSRVMINLETIVGGYIRGQLLTSILMSVFIFILLSAIGVKAALALALFGGAADVLPYVGIFLTMAPVVLSAVSKGIGITAIVFVLMFIYEEFEGRFLIPIIYGKALRLPSSVILFALFVGATLMGFVGALLALPIAAAIRMLIIELRIDLPGQIDQEEDVKIKKMDALSEQEYELRTEGMSVNEASAIAVEISDERKKEEESYIGSEKINEEGT